MNPNNIRKEPTFGEATPATDSLDTVAQATAEKPAQTKQTLSFSVHSNQSPGHTFTPVMKRPVENAQQFATLEEQKMLNGKPATATSSAPVQPAVQPAPRTSFAFTPVEKSSEQAHANTTAETVTKPAVTSVETATTTTKTTQELPKTVPTMTTNNIERVIPTQAQAAPKKASVAEKVPSKYRRLLLVALLTLALILIFFLLKPKAPETVEELQEQGTNLPIEFRPVNEAEAKRAEEEAKALQQQQEAEQQALAAQQAQQAQQTQPTEASTATDNNTATPENTQQAVQNSENNANEQPVAVAKPAAPVVNKPVVIEPIKKPATSGSVIHQPENTPAEPAKKTVVVKAEPAKTELAKAAQQPAQLVKVKAEPTKEPVKAAPAQTVAKPAQPAAAATAPTAANTSAGGAVASKTITVQKGVSLFQNFRDNGLAANLPELNKMTKLNGETSRLSPGQKISVRLDSNNRIVEMNIGSGKYIRQTDGSYIYK